MSVDKSPVSPNIPEDSHERRVFIGNLAYGVDDAGLKAHFASCGKVTEAHVVQRYGKSAGFGFVTFETEDQASTAAQLKDSELEGRPINVERCAPREEGASRRGRGRRGRGRGRGRGHRAQREQTGEPSKTTLFVGNLPYNVVDDDLNNIFKDLKIANAHVVRRFDGGSRGFGFVTCESSEEQAKALEVLSDVWCDDRKLIIRPSYSDDAYNKKSEEGQDL